MKAWKVIGVGLLGYAAVSGYMLYSTAKDLVTSFGFPKKIKVDLSNWLLTFNLPVTIINTKSDAVKVNGINLGLFDNGGVQLGRAYIIDSFIIPKNSQTTVNVSCLLSIQSLLEVVPFIDVTKKIDLTFKGSLTASNVFTVPINYKMSLTLLADIIQIIANNKGKSTKNLKTISRANLSQLFNITQEERNEWALTWENKSLAA